MTMGTPPNMIRRYSTVFPLMASGVCRSPRMGTTATCPKATSTNALMAESTAEAPIVRRRCPICREPKFCAIIMPNPWVNP